MGQTGRAQVGTDPSRPSDADELRADPRQHRRSCRGSEGASLEGRGVRTDERPERGQHHRSGDGKDGGTGGRRPHARGPDVFPPDMGPPLRRDGRREAVEGRLHLLSQGRDADPLVQEGIHDADHRGRRREGPRGAAADDLLAAAHLRNFPPARGRQPLRAGPQYGHVGEDAGAVLRAHVDPRDGERIDQDPGEGEEDAAVGVRIGNTALIQISLIRSTGS